MARRKKRINKIGSSYTIIVLILLFITAILAIFSKNETKFFSYGNNSPEANFTPEPAKNSLQLYSFPNLEDLSPGASFIPTIALVPPASSDKNPPAEGCGIANPILIRGTENGKCCVQDGPVNNPSECCSGVPYCDLTKNPPVGSPGITCSCGATTQQAGGSQQMFSGTCGQHPYWCNAKPVIYLYPKTNTKVSVKVDVPGSIFISIPEYPEGGWKDVEAYPDGTLIYQGKKYNELFYESTITPITPPDSGIIVEKGKLLTALKDITTRLGLISHEQNEFLDYWMPHLSGLNTPYVQLSVFSPEAKDSIDKVEINPKPDTFIQFIMYFKGLEKPVPLEHPALPENIPSRQGFTAVEWGGIIDN